MPLTKPNDIAIHEAGHILICYLMNDLAELHFVTIDAEYGKTIDKYSDGGLVFKYINHPDNLNFFELDQFCLLHLSGLAADLVNEHDGKISQEYFGSRDFFSKIGQFYYQGDMISFNTIFSKFQNELQVSPRYYNYISISLLTNMLSDMYVIKVLLDLRKFIWKYKTIDGKFLYDFLNNTYLREFSNNYWLEIKEIRKKLFIK